MRIAIVSDTEGRLIGIAPVHDTAGPATVDGPALTGRIIARDGHVLHELEVNDDFHPDRNRVSRFPETDRVREGQLPPNEAR